MAIFADLNKFGQLIGTTDCKIGDAAVKATIWHNPGCGTSRKTLAILQETPGIELSVIEYKQTPFSRAKLEQLFADAGITSGQALRSRGTDAEQLGLTAGSDNATLLDAMTKDAMLVERPFVETGKGVRLCRPQELVHEIL
jgi:arsenate reductase